MVIKIWYQTKNFLSPMFPYSLVINKCLEVTPLSLMEKLKGCSSSNVLFSIV